VLLELTGIAHYITTIKKFYNSLYTFDKIPFFLIIIIMQCTTHAPLQIGTSVMYNALYSADMIYLIPTGKGPPEKKQKNMQTIATDANTKT